MHSSLDTFSTPAGVPTTRLPFVDVSGVCRTPIGPGGPRRLEMCPTSSDRSVISLSIFGPPPNHRPIRLPNVSSSADQRSPSGNLQDKISSGLLVPLYTSSPITRAAPAAAGIPRHRRVQHHHRPGAQYRPNAPCLLGPLMSLSRNPSLLPGSRHGRPAAAVELCSIVLSGSRAPSEGTIGQRRLAYHPLLSCELYSRDDASENQFYVVVNEGRRSTLRAALQARASH